jgi:hypothetical protein
MSLRLFFEGLLENMADVSTPPARGRHGGSVPGWRYVYRDHEACHEQLFKDYFAEECTFDAVIFRRRFRMRRSLFLHIVEKVCTFDPWLFQRRDGVGRLGLSSL